MLCGHFDIEAIEQAFFNHDCEGAESKREKWEERREQWRSFKTYLAAHPRQETLPERGGDKCPVCDSPEVSAYTPRTVYACGSSDYDRRPGSFKQSNFCFPNSQITAPAGSGASEVR